MEKVKLVVPLRRHENSALRQLNNYDPEKLEKIKVKDDINRLNHVKELASIDNDLKDLVRKIKVRKYISLIYQITILKIHLSKLLSKVRSTRKARMLNFHMVQRHLHKKTDFHSGLVQNQNSLSKSKFSQRGSIASRNTPPNENSMRSFVGNLKKEKQKVIVQIEPMMPICMGKLKDTDESWKCRKSEVRKKRLRRVAHNQFFFAKRNAYKVQSNPKNLINKRNRLLENVRQLHIHEIKTKNEKKLRKSLHIKQKGEFLKSILKINRIELISRGEKALREVVKKEVVKAKNTLKIREDKLEKFKDDKHLVVSEATKRRAGYMKNAERFIKEMIDNLRKKGINKLSIDFITEKGSLEKGVIVDVKKKEVLVKNSEIIRNLIKKSSYSKFIGKLSGKKENISIKADPKFESGISQPSETFSKVNIKMELVKKKGPIRMMKFDSNIRSPIEARSLSKESKIDEGKPLNIINFSKEKGSLELIPKSDVQVRPPAIVKVTPKVSISTKINEPKSLVDGLPTENQILKAKTVETLKKDSLNAKRGIPSKVLEKNNTSLFRKQLIIKNTKVLPENDSLNMEIHAKETSKKEFIAKQNSKELAGILSKDTPALEGKSKSTLLKAIETKKGAPVRKMSDMPNSGDQDQNKELTKTLLKSFSKSVVTKPHILSKTDLCKKGFPNKLGNAKLTIIPKKKANEILSYSKSAPKSLPDVLEKEDYNLLIYDSNKYWCSRLYDLYRRMKGESSQANSVSKKCLKKERRRLSTQNGAEKRRIKIYTRLRVINEADSKGRRQIRLLLKPGSVKRYGIPALMSYSYRNTSQALSSNTEQNYLVQKFSTNYTDKSHIEYILEDTNSYVFGIHKHHELLSIARNTFNEDIQFCRMSKLSKYALKTKMSDLEQFVEEVMGEMIINGDLKQDSRENMLENNIMRLRYLVNTDKEEKQSLSGCKSKSRDETNQLWDKLVSRFDLTSELSFPNRISNAKNLWIETSKFIYDEEIDFFKKVYYLSDLRDLGNINIDNSIIESILKSARVPYDSQDFKFPFIFSKEIGSSKNTGYYRRDFISYVGKLSPWTKIALIQKKKNKPI
ncbi:uncharacterized protein ELE39_003065 [Cryptosporidium sp. chipmunk genotype I]|uniref:uncharacterized protein n=1 Tax=Cryptosporidium sp. chipmunk genotype I TaxID=1280935 RepID=UPI00351A2EA3|nr:hypothetical protein ELE39_003065 [Cryptosporidium sp. chipmunk genotype I]